MGWKIQGSIPCRDKKCVFSPKHPDWLWGLPSLLGGWEGGVWKWQGHETDHSPSYGAEVKNQWSCTLSPP